METLYFYKGTQEASVVTDGVHHATYTSRGREWHKTLSKAIAHLESKGFKINIELWKK